MVIWWSTPYRAIQGMPLQQDGARHGLQTRPGGTEQLAPPRRTQPVAQADRRRKVHRRNRSRQPTTSSRRLTRTVTKIRLQLLERQHRALQAQASAAPRRPPSPPLRQGHGPGARVSRRHARRLPRAPMPGAIPNRRRAHRHPNPAGRVIRFDATGRSPVDKWTAAPRLTTSPQGQQHQPKRSTHLVHKPVNSECSRQVGKRWIVERADARKRRAGQGRSGRASANRVLGAAPTTGRARNRSRRHHHTVRGAWRACPGPDSLFCMGCPFAIPARADG